MRLNAVVGVALVAAWLSMALAGPAQAATFTRDVGTTESFTNGASIPIADGHCDDTYEDSVQGVAAPYPSQIEVSGMTGTITDVNLTLTRVSHRYLQDLRVLLVAPGGQKVLVLHGADDRDGSGEVQDVTWKFDDAWDDEVDYFDGSVAVSYSDLGCPAVDIPDSLPAPAPEGPYGSALADFNGAAPNGMWQLYVVDMFDDETGVIDGGWSLEITTGIAIGDGECYDGPPEQAPASSYPSTIDVAGLSGNVTDVDLTLKNYSHQIPGDVRMLLVGPAGQKVLVIHHVGTVPNTTAGNEISDQTLILDDEADDPISVPITGGTYLPTRIDDENNEQICGEFLESASLPGPAPAAPYATALGAFDGSSANGTWSLYIVDDFGDASGSLDGWALDITTDDAYAGEVLGDEPAGYWRFGEPSGTFLTDSSGNANHGTYLGGVTLGVPGALAGNPNTAATYDGVDDIGRVPDSASLKVGSSFTFEGWIKRSSTTKAHQMIMRGNGLQVSVMNAGSGNQVFLRKANVTTIARSAGGVPADGNYHHIVATMNGPGTARIYIDGVDDTVQLSAVHSIADTAFPLIFGTTNSGSAQFDEFALYDEPLTPGKVGEHYDAGAPPA